MRLHCTFLFYKLPNPVIIHPKNKVTKHLKLSSRFLSEEDMLMVPNVDELRFKKIYFGRTEEYIKQSIEKFVRELLYSHSDYTYHAVQKLAPKVDGTVIFIIVLKHKKHGIV